jgi:hypothetical protein
MVDGRHTATLRIAAFALEGEGAVLGEDWKVMDLHLKEESYCGLLQSGIPFSIVMPLLRPGRVFRVIVYDPGSDRVGSRRLTDR